VYAELRGRGIHPINVNERIIPVVKKGLSGLRKRDWVVIAAAPLFLFALGMFLVRNGKSVRMEPEIATPASTSPAYRAMEVAVGDILARFRAALPAIDNALIVNYALLERSADDSEFRREIAKGLDSATSAAAAIRNLYAAHYDQIPDQASQVAAQHLYGRAMDEVDAVRERYDGESCALTLLVENRGKWRVAHGRVVWDDPQLEREFLLFRRLELSTMTRFERDFPAENFQNSP